MRILHTSDWHLGQNFYGLSRESEHRRFLDWLLDVLVERKVDALLVAGDIFDSANPPAAAQSMYYRFLADCRRRCPDLDIVITGGNHDSPSRLEAPKPILESFCIHVVGGIGGRLDLDVDDLIVPLHNADGQIAAWCCAMPFLRPADLPSSDLIEGVRKLYHQAFEQMRQCRDPQQSIVAMGHTYLVGTQISALSERKILGGNLHAVPADIFPEDIAYVALGHLHRPQSVAGRQEVRYSGSPIPLAIDEGAYPHQVVLADLSGTESECTTIEEIRCPRFVDVIRIPKGGLQPLDVVLEDLRSLDVDVPQGDYPYLEVSVLLDKPQPSLRCDVEEALKGKSVRLCKLTPHYCGEGTPLSEAVKEKHLGQLIPEEVFTQCYRKEYGGDPPNEMVAAFCDLLDEACQEEKTKI